MPPRAYDVHVHVGADHVDADLPTLKHATKAAGVRTTVAMTVPMPLVAWDARATSSLECADFLGAPCLPFKVLYGGGELNPLLHAVGRTKPWTMTSVFPNGASGLADESMLAQMEDIAAAEGHGRRPSRIGRSRPRSRTGLSASWSISSRTTGGRVSCGRMPAGRTPATRPRGC
jgi:hypothetical protein